MKLVSFSLSTQCSLPSTAKLASTHLDNIGFHKHQKNSPPAIANIRQLLRPSIEPPRRQLPLSKPPGKMVSLNKVQVASYCQTEQKLDFKEQAKWPTDQPSNTGVDQACMGLSTRSWPKAAIKIHAGEHKRSCCVDVHRIKTAQKSKSCQSTKTEPLKKKYCLSHSCALLLPVIYFSPFVSPKTAILLLERLNIPVTDISDSEPIIYNIIIYRTTPSLSILSRQEYIAATWWEFLFKIYLSEHFPTWTAESVFKRWGSCPCTGRNPPDSESWQSIINSTTPSL